MSRQKDQIVPLTDEQRKMVEENHNLIYKVIHDNFLDVEECYDIAAIGLCRAAQKFDSNAGFKFSTYAYTSIWNNICREYNLSRTQNKIPEEEIISLNTKIKNSDDGVLEDILASKDTFEDDVVAVEKYKKALSCLNARDQNVILLLADGYTYEAAGKVFGISRERVCQIIKKYAYHVGYKRDRKRKYNRSVR